MEHDQHQCDRSRGWFKVPAALVLNGWLSVLTHAELRVWLTLRHYARGDGLAFPSHEKVSALTGLDTRTVGKAITSLTRRGLLAVDVVGGGRGKPSKRRVLVPETPAAG